MKRKINLLLFTVCLLLSVSVLHPSAETLETMPEAYREWEECLPEDMAELLPDGFFSSDPNEALSAAETLTKPAYLFRVFLEAVGLRLREMLGLAGTLMGMILLSAILHRLRESMTGAVGEGMAFILRLCMYVLIVTKAVAMVSWVKTYFERLSVFVTGLVPVMGILYALGGNVASAAVNEEILLLFLAICDYVTTSVTPAVCGICMAFSLLDALGHGAQVRFSYLSTLFKKWYTGLLGFIMFVLSVALSAQNVLASGADSIAMKGVRYAVGQMIPVVGGAIAGSMGTVATGVGLLRSVTGVSGVILVGLLLLPALVQLLLFRMCYQFASSVAAMLGCEGESKLLGEIGSLYGYMIAAVSMTAVVCVLALGIFIGTASVLI